jgi:hypothetical protein
LIGREFWSRALQDLYGGSKVIKFAFAGLHVSVRLDAGCQFVHDEAHAPDVGFVGVGLGLKGQALGAPGWEGAYM